jgi:hypothetical protein
VENACQIPARVLPAEQFIHIEQTLRMREEDQERVILRFTRF